MNKIIDLRNKRNTLWEQTKAFLEEHRGENGLVAADAVEQYDRMAAEVKALGDEIARLEAQAEMDARLSAATSAPVHNGPSNRKPNEIPTATAEYNAAFWDMMRGNNTPEVRNALSVGTGSAGGYTVPAEFERQLVQALDENNVFRTMGCHVIRTNSGTRTIPIATDNGAASWIEEGTSIQESDMTFSQETLSAFKLGCMVKVSNELLNDSAFDIASYIAQRFGVRFGHAEEDAFINGTGVSQNPQVTPSQPTGIMTTLTTPAVTTGGATTIDFDDVFKLYYGLRAPYRKNAKFLCNETVMLKLMTLKDGQSNYIWKPGMEIGKPDTLLGHPVYTSTYMPGLTGTASTDKNKKTLLFGDFSYFWIADRQNRTLKRLNELYAVNDQVGFIGTQRVDGKLILGEAIQYMKMGAS